MRLTQNNDVVHTLAPDRSDQPFSKAILPRRSWCGRLVPDAHGAQSACDDAAIDPIPIADEVPRSLIPRKCFRYLTCNPLRGRVCCDRSSLAVYVAQMWAFIFSAILNRGLQPKSAVDRSVVRLSKAGEAPSRSRFAPMRRRRGALGGVGHVQMFLVCSQRVEPQQG